jgi:uncharacterized protein (TIRG00374 family)
VRISGRTLRTLVAVAAGAAVTFLLLGSGGDLTEAVQRILASVSSADPKYLGIALLLFITSQVARAWRWKLLSWEHPIQMGKALPLNAIHVGLGHLLPLRLADPALVGLFRYYGRLSLGRGTATVVLSKLLDMAAMGTLVSCAVAGGLSGSAAFAAALVGILSLAAVFFIAGILSVLKKPFLKATRGRFEKGYDNLAQAVTVGSGRRGRFAASYLLSLLAWSVKLLMFVFLLRAMGVDFQPVWKVLVAGAVTDATLAMPVHGLLGLGTLEAGWVAGFAVVGVTGELAPGLGIVEAGFSMHLLWMFFAVLLMTVGGMYLLVSGREGK